MTKEKFISLQIQALLEIDIFKNKRDMKTVDARSLYCYILRKDFNYTLYSIRDTFRANGKKFDHSSVHHNVNLFEEVRWRRKEMEDIRNTILKRLDPKFELLQIIEDIKDEKIIKQIINCINSKQ